MLFNSYAFIVVFFPIVLLVSLRLRGPALIRWVTICSLVFYSFAGHAWFVIPMLFTTILDFFLAKLIFIETNLKRKKILLCVSLTGNLGLLFLFKYAGLFSFKTFISLGLPAGISFYTFQTMSYIIDVYRGDCEVEKSFWKFSCFVSFFPHLVAGPLTRHDQLIPQLDRIEKTGISPRWNAGIYFFAVGLCKKVLIADRIGNLIDPMLLNIESLTFFSSWLTLIGYALQIYFDFSGYSEMAVGLGRLFNIELPQNFNSPYKALNPSDFWKRWHITLSQWLRDYLYISLGGSRKGFVRQNINLMITMVLGGFWHGANWTFMLWGFFHGLILIIYHLFSNEWDRLAIRIQRGLTLILVCFGWVFFRAQTLRESFIWIGRLIGLGDSDFHWSLDYSTLSFLVLSGLAITQFAPNIYSWKSFELAPRRQFAMGVAVLTALILMNYSSKFLYYQF